MTNLRHELFAKLRSPIVISAAIAGSILTSLAGPFGTYEAATFGERLVYWPIIVIVSIVIALTFSIVVNARAGEEPIYKRVLYVSSLMTICFVPLIYVVTMVFFGTAVRNFPWATATVAVFVVTTFLDFVRLHVISMFATQNPQISAGRLDPVGDEKIMHVSVDVFTTGDDRRILMRFSDALRELAHVDGIQVHRSHWVAAGAVKRTQKRNGQASLLLNCGTEIPVSRTFEDRTFEFFGNPN